MKFRVRYYHDRYYSLMVMGLGDNNITNHIPTAISMLLMRHHVMEIPDLTRFYRMNGPRQ